MPAPLRAASVAALFLLAACATKRPPSTAVDPTLVTPRNVSIATTAGTIETRTTTEDRAEGTNLKMTPDVAWKVLPAAYADIGLPVNLLVTDTRQIGSKNNRLRARLGKLRLASLISCGADMLGEDKANSYEVNLDVNTVVTPIENGQSRVTTLLVANARPMATSGDMLHCSSTGQLEKRIANAVLVRSASQ